MILHMTRPNPFGPEVERIPHHLERQSIINNALASKATNLSYDNGSFSENYGRAPLNVPVAFTMLFFSFIGCVFIYFSVTNGVSRGHLIMAIGFLLPPAWFGVAYLLKFDHVSKLLAWSMAWVTAIMILTTGLYKLYPQEFTNVTTIL